MKYDEESFGYLLAQKRKKERAGGLVKERSEKRPAEEKKEPEQAPLIDELISMHKIDEQKKEKESAKSPKPKPDEASNEISDDQSAEEDEKSKEKGVGKSFFNDSLFRYFRKNRSSNRRKGLYVKTRANIVIRPNTTYSKHCWTNIHLFYSFCSIDFIVFGQSCWSPSPSGMSSIYPIQLRLTPRSINQAHGYSFLLTLWEYSSQSSTFL